MPQVSVHIVTYNNAATIPVTLQSVLGQRYTDFDLLVIDNASDDPTPDIVQQFPCIFIQNFENTGYAAAHNQAIHQTDSRYVLTLNPDIRLNENFLGELVKALDTRPDFGSAAGCLLRVENLDDLPKTIDSTGLYMTPSRRQRLRLEGLPPANCPKKETEIFGPDGAAAFYRRDMLEDIRVLDEIFDPDFFMHKEDVDVCWRAQLRGWSSIFVPGAIAYHVRHFRPGQRQTVSPYMRFLGVRNRYLLMLKNDIPAHFWRDLPAIAFYDLRILAYLLWRERSSLRAFGSIWQLRQQMLKKRRIIQVNRQVDWRHLRCWFKRQPI